MKKDAMGNGQLKPTFNLLHGADSEYITWLTIGSQPTDATTLIQFLKDAGKHLNLKYLKIVTDASYESEENYLFLESNGQTAFIKPANYEMSKTRKYKSDIGRIENMDYEEEKDAYACKNGRELPFVCTRHSKSKTGYVSEKNIYQCKDAEVVHTKINVSKGTIAKRQWRKGIKCCLWQKLF